MGTTSRVLEQVRNCVAVAAVLGFVSLPASAGTSRVPSHLETTTNSESYDETQLLLDRGLEAPSASRRFAARKGTLLKYKRSFSVGQNDMLLKVKAPGKRKSFVSMELIF